MKYLALVLPLLLLTAAKPPAHEFHVSITTMKHNTEKNELQISVKLTTHDVEYALEEELGGIAHFGSDKESELARTALKNYLLKHLTLVTEEETLSLEYIGKEVEFENMYCYLQVSGFEKYKYIEVKNSLLFDRSDIQSNVVHLENSRGIKTHTCSPAQPVVRFTP